MYSYLRSLKLKQAVLVEAPSVTLSIIVAEIFYKFHSFTLECVAFLVTWLVVSSMLASATSLFTAKAEQPAT